MTEIIKSWSHKGTSPKYFPYQLLCSLIHSYLTDLQQKVARLEQSQSVSSNAPALRQDEPNAPEGDERGESQEEEQPQQATPSPGDTRESSPGREPVTNPLIESPSKFMSSSSGRSCECAELFVESNE